MRNRYPGTCYRCGEHVAAGHGHFERHHGGWRTQHSTCAIKHRASERIEARRAETPKSGSVHESRAEGLAQPQSSTGAGQ